MKRVKEDLQSIAKGLEELREKTEEASRRVSELSKTAPLKKPVGRKNVATSTVTDQVIRVMKRHRKGIDVATLVKKTGFGKQKIRNTLNRAYREGKISRIQRGVYVAL